MNEMEIDELDSLPAKVERGELTNERAAMKIMEVLYTNPGRFRLLDMDEDERSDFLLCALEKFERVMNRYDKRLGPLGAYIYYSIPGMRLSWNRKRVDAEIGKRGAAPSVKKIYEDSIQRKTLAVADSKALRKAGAAEREAPPLVFKKILNEKRSLLESKASHTLKRSALVLALKSAWYIDDKNVEKVSGCLGCSSESVAAALAQVKNSLIARDAKRAEIVERRDKAWYLVCKYRERLLFLDPNSSAWKLVKRKLDYQLASWKNKTRLLQSCRMKVTPRNVDLAKMLCVHPYRISAYLQYARRMAESGASLLSFGDESEAAES